MRAERIEQVLDLISVVAVADEERPAARFGVEFGGDPASLPANEGMGWESKESVGGESRMAACDPSSEGDCGDADLSFGVVELAWGDRGMR